MARIDKSQTGARGGVGREADGTRTPRTEPTRSKVGLERPREGPREIEGGDLSAFDARATNVAARPAGTRGQRTRRGSVDEGDRSTARVAPRRARARPSAKSEPPTPRPPSPMGKSTPAQGTATRPVRAAPARHARDETATDRDERATKNAPARGTTARSARATRGGDERESAVDRSVSGARRAPATRTNGAKKATPKKGRAGNRDATS